MRETCRVSFQPDGRSVFVIKGTNLIEAAGQAGIIINIPCGGKGVCGKCKVQIQQNPPGPTAADVKHIKPRELEDGYRLACQCKLVADTVVYIPDHLRLFEQIVLTEGEEREFLLQPNIRKCHLKLREPSVEDPRSDEDRLREKLADACADVKISLEVMRTLPAALRDSRFDLTTIVDQDELIGLEPGDTTGSLHGVAFDVGTTTVVGVLVDLLSGRTVATCSRTNPQVRFGDDVISRINHAQSNGTGLPELQQGIIDCINEMIGELAQSAGVARNLIYEVTFVGNTTMNHIVMHVDPSWIAHAPYVSVFRRGLYTRAQNIGVRITPNGKVFSLPNIAGFIGADTVGVVLATGMHHSEKLQLAIDIGTNGELVIGNKDRLVSCSCAAGPAFEGARIHYGMRAADGAISKLVIDGDIRVAVIGGGPARGICGSGLIDTVAELLSRGMIDPTGRIRDESELPADLPDTLRRRIVEFNDAPAVALVSREDSRIGEPIVLTQKDVREVQLAKGAIRAGIEILLSRYGVTLDQLETILLAGGFGNFIRRSNAVRIGLLPQVPTGKILFVGNAALVGAKMALASHGCRAEAEQISERVEYLELANVLEFQMAFAEAMMFPE